MQTHNGPIFLLLALLLGVASVAWMRNVVVEGLDASPPCTLPPNLGKGVIGGDKLPCVGNQSIADGGMCTVQCDTGFEPRGGTTQYHCHKGKLDQATLQCDPKTCPLPSEFKSGVKGAGENPCIAGSSLMGDQSCSVKCKKGFRSKGGTTTYRCPLEGELQEASLGCERATCALPGKFGEGITRGGQLPCEAGGTLLGGEHCTVGCAVGYSEAGGNPTYLCGSSGILDKASLACSRNKCRLPDDLGEGRTPGGNIPCPAGGEIDSGGECTVQCKPGYKPISGNGAYMCDQRGILSDASLQCERIACTLPADFGDGIMGAGDKPCKAGGKLIAGDSCSVECGRAYDAIGIEMRYGGIGARKEYKCSKAGFLMEPGLRCQKTEVRPYNSVWSIDLAGVLG